MKIVQVVVSALVVSVAFAFQQPTTCSTTPATTSASRREVLESSVVAVGSAAVLLLPQSAQARGFATLEQAYERYTPRIRKGGDFYSTDFKALVRKNDWSGIRNALQEVPKRERTDLSKPDAGVAERARQAGQFSDARVLVAGTYV